MNCGICVCLETLDTVTNIDTNTSSVKAHYVTLGNSMCMN